jgi:c-di-GMP-binding flagellar brake protein YcgR
MDSTATIADNQLASSVVHASSSFTPPKERRKRRRVAVQPMYTAVMLRVLNQRREPMEGHAVDVSESGVSVEVDSHIPPGTAVTVELTVAGMGQLRGRQWPTFAAAAEVVRDASQEDFPQGPYRVGLRFMRMSTIMQAQIARFVVSHTPTES